MADQQDLVGPQFLRRVGQHLSGIEAQSDGAIALIAMFCQWMGTDGESPQAKHWVGPVIWRSFIAFKGGSARISQPAPVPLREAPIWGGYQRVC